MPTLLAPHFSEAGDAKVRAAAGAALRRLVGALPSRQEAVRLLSRRAKEYFEGQQPVQADVEGRVELWTWDAAKRQLVATNCAADYAARVLAARFARDAYALAKDDPEVRLLYLATALEAAAYQTGLDRPLPEGPGTVVAEAITFGVPAIEHVLEYTMENNHAAAATAAARILGQIGKADELLYKGAGPAPLVRAVTHPDRQLRMAAADTVVRLQPVRPFAGSSYVPEVLGFFAASGGARRVLVAGPNREAAREVAGMLAKLGLNVDTAVSGRELLNLATASPDYEMAMIDAGIDRPTIDLLVQQLRHNWRTADFPLGIIARETYLPRAEQVARRDPLCRAFSRPHDDQSIAWQVAQLMGLSPRAFVTHAERQQQAARALDLLAELAASGQKLYDVVRQQDAVFVALQTPGLSAKAANVLGNLGTPESQRALVELASRWTQPIEVRRAAAAALARNIRRNGILLTTAEITRQYDRYNQSQDRDAATQQVLGFVLDCIEAPTQVVKASTQ